MRVFSETYYLHSHEPLIRRDVSSRCELHTGTDSGAADARRRDARFNIEEIPPKPSLLATSTTYFFNGIELSGKAEISPRCLRTALMPRIVASRLDRPISRLGRHFMSLEYTFRQRRPHRRLRRLPEIIYTGMMQCRRFTSRAGRFHGIFHARGERKRHERQI